MTFGSVRSDLHSIFHLLQLLQRFFVRGDELCNIVPGGSAWENIFEHVQSCVVSGHLLHLGDTFSYARLVNQDLSVPQTALSSSLKDGVRSGHGPLFDLKSTRLLLLKSVHEGHGFVLFGQLLVLLAVKDLFVVDRCISFVAEGLQLLFGVLEKELFLCPGLACHLDYLIQGECIELLLKIVSFFWVFLNVHHVVE